MSLEDLRRFIKEEMPILNDEMGRLTLTEVREVMNKMTGLDVAGHASISQSSKKFLDALSDEKRNGTLIIGAMARGLAKVREIKERRPRNEDKLQQARNDA